MESKLESKFAVYVPTRSSPQYFGKVVTIVGAKHDGTYQFRTECFLLLEHDTQQQAVQSIYQKHVTFSSRDLPNDALRVDLDFMLDVGLELAKSKIAELLIEAFRSGKDSRIFSNPFDFDPAAEFYLARLAILDHWRKELGDILAFSKCPILKEHLQQVLRYPSVMVAPHLSADAAESGIPPL